MDTKSASRSSAGSCQSRAGTSIMLPTSRRDGAGRTRAASAQRSAARRAELANGRDHREHDGELAPAGGQQQGAKLAAQQHRAVEADPQGAPAHRRVLLRGRGRAGQELVASEIERAEAHRPVAGKVEDAGVDRRLLGNVAHLAAGEHGDLGAEQADPVGADGVELRHLLGESDVEHERERDAVRGPLRPPAHRDEARRARRAGVDGAPIRLQHARVRAEDEQPLIRVQHRLVVRLERLDRAARATYER